MQTNLTNGVIYKGSDAEITVSLFPRCMTVTEFSGLTVDFFTAEGGHSIHYDGDSLAISGQTATVHFQWEALNGLDDGLLRYNVSCTIEGKAYTMDMETRWFLKTPSSYTPQDFVSKDEVEAVVDEAMTGYTKTDEVQKVVDEAMTGYTKTDEVRKVVDEAMTGYTKTDEVRKVVDEAMTGYTKTDEVRKVVDEAMTGYTKTEEFSTIEGMPLTDGTDIQINRVKSLNGMDGGINITGTSVTNNTQTKTITIEVPTKTSQLTNDSGYLTEHQELKTINNQSIVGSGNIEISGGEGNVKSDTVDTIWTGTQTEYDALGTYSDSTLYIIKS